jgi:hypothetical protein
MNSAKYETLGMKMWRRVKMLYKNGRKHYSKI